MPGDSASAAVAALRAAVDALVALDLSRLAEASLLDFIRELERQSRRLAATENLPVAELAGRGTAERLGHRDLASLLGDLLSAAPREAAKRISAADRFGPRTDLSGGVLPPRYPVLAEGLRAGEFSHAHGRVITETIESLPPAIRAADGATVETTLAAQAKVLNPRQLAALARRVVAHLDPDGRPPAEAESRRTRSFELAQLGGSGDIRATLTPACLAIWQTVLTPLARKRDSDAAGPDPRTPAQRWHDAFEEAGRMLLASDQLPAQAGTATTLVLTIDLHDLERRVGVATTQHGGALSVDEALRLAAGQRVIPVVCDNARGIVAFGRSRRLASPGQRYALLARDRGCTFPGCTVPAARAEVHHVVDWSRGGATDLDGLALACGYHNNEGPRQGWAATLIKGIPHWIPPAWRDPQRRPVRNVVHHPELARGNRPPWQEETSRPGRSDSLS